MKAFGPLHCSTLRMTALDLRPDPEDESNVVIHQPENSVQGRSKGSHFTLYSNALLLLLGNVTNALAGLAFWTIVAGLYRPQDVGVAAAVIAGALLSAQLGQLGLGFGYIKFRPERYSQRARQVSWTLTSVGMMAAAAGLAFALGSGLWSPPLAFLQRDLVYMGAFTAFAALASLSIVLPQILLGEGRADFAALANGVQAAGKVIVGASLVFFWPAAGMIVGWAAGSAISAVVSILLLKRVIMSFHARFRLDLAPSREFVLFSLSNYLGNLLSVLPTLVLPLIVINMFDSATNAYFYVAWTMGSAISAVSVTLGHALFAENARRGRVFGQLSGTLFAGVIVSAGALGAVLFYGEGMLQVFGRDYASEATSLLIWTTAAAIPLAINNIYLNVMRIQAKNAELLILSLLGSMGTILLAVALLDLGAGIKGAGVALLITQLLLSTRTLRGIYKFGR